MAVCILGASGTLGTMLVDYLSKTNPVVATVRDVKLYKSPANNVEYRQLDALTSQVQDIKEIVKDCTVIINAIGAIPQRHVANRNIMIELNYSFLKKLQCVGIPVLQIATDCVFPGITGKYSEQSTRGYHDFYGCTKSLSEFQSDTIKYLRCSIVGRGQHDSYSLLGWFLSRPYGDSISGYIDHYWNGITTLAFAKICDGLIRNGINQAHQIQHIVPADTISKCDLLRLFRTNFNRTDIRINEAKTEKVDRTLSTIRPGINKKYWELAGYGKPPTIEYMIQELAEYLK